MILALEIAEDVYEINSIGCFDESVDNEPTKNLNPPTKVEKMGLLKRIKRGIEFLGDWFSDASDDKLITEYGFLRTFVDWD